MFARLLAALVLGLLLLGCSAAAERVADEPAASQAWPGAADLQQALGEGADLPEMAAPVPAPQPHGAHRQRRPAAAASGAPSPDPRALHRPPDTGPAFA